MKITIEISDADAMYISRLIDLVNLDDANTHGNLTFEMLGRVLFEDVALAMRRPGSWEGANMAQVLSSHGYQL
jgi:hypothetical protein